MFSLTKVLGFATGQDVKGILPSSSREGEVGRVDTVNGVDMFIIYIFGIVLEIRFRGRACISPREKPVL